MKKVCFLLVVLCAMSSIAMAAPTAEVLVVDRSSRPHTLQIVSGNLGTRTAGYTWEGFCLEQEAPVNEGEIYDGEQSDVIHPSGNPLTMETVWLANNWQTYGGGATQQAIWYRQGSLGAISLPAGQQAYDDAVAAVAGGYSAQNVKVVQLTNDRGEAQDHTIMVPAPGAVLLGGLGTLLVGFFRKR